MVASKKIKVLFRHRSMEMGGVEKVLLSIIKHLDSNLFDVTVLLSINQGELRDEFPDYIRKVYLEKGKEDFSKNFFIKKIQLFKRKRKLEKLLQNPKIIDEKILQDQYDIEIAMTYNDFPLVLNSTNPKSKKIAWFHSEINLEKLQPLVPQILKHFPKFDHIVYCSQKIKDLMHLHYPDLAYPGESVIVNAIPIEEIKEKSNLKINDFTETVAKFVSIGRLHTRKGYHKLIDAHEKLISEGYQHKIYVLGDGEELQNLQKQIKNKKVQNSFVLLGNKMNPYPYLKQSDYFILPSESEAWPLVIAEALILQKPIIATDTGDVSKMILHGKTGHLIHYDTQEMYEAMKKFLTEPNYVNSIKENLKNIENQFENKKINMQIHELLTQISQ